MKSKCGRSCLKYIDTKKFKHLNGKQFGIQVACLDTGGSGGMTSRAYEYVRSRPMGKPYAIKGRGGAIPLYSKPTPKSRKR